MFMKKIILFSLFSLLTACTSPGRDGVFVPQEPVLEVQQFTHGLGADTWYHGKGVVKNISNEPIEGVVVSVRMNDKDGNMVTTQPGPIEMNPLMPGQSSSFDALYQDDIIQSAEIEGISSNGNQIVFKSKE